MLNFKSLRQIVMEAIKRFFQLQ